MEGSVLPHGTVGEHAAGRRTCKALVPVPEPLETADPIARGGHRGRIERSDRRVF